MSHPLTDALPDYLDALALRQACGEIEAGLRATLAYAEAALADIGDADREPEDDLAWCEQRAAEALPCVRAALETTK
jgi:hypothetical protein